MSIIEYHQLQAEIEQVREELEMYLDRQLFDPRVDFAFKRMLGNDKSADSQGALKDFPNAVLELPEGKQIRACSIINNEFTVDSPSEKKALMDVHVRTEDETEMIIEMQLQNADNFVKRTEYLLAKLFSSQQLRGKLYDQLTKAIVISVVDFTLFSDRALYHSVFHFRERSTHSCLSEDLELHYLELTKLQELNDKPLESLQPKERWMLFLKYAGQPEKAALVQPCSLKVSKEQFLYFMARKDVQHIFEDIQLVTLESRWILPHQILVK